jgi:hypothetical protein
MVEHPIAWPWSSFAGYADIDRRLDCVGYDELLESWGHFSPIPTTRSTLVTCFGLER